MANQRQFSIINSFSLSGNALITNMVIALSPYTPYKANSYAMHASLTVESKLTKKWLKKALLYMPFLLLLTTILLTSNSFAKVVTVHPAVDYGPSLSADGRFLAFVSERSGNREIWLKDLSPGSDGIPQQITKHPAADDAPALSKNGSQLLYVAYETDPRGDIHLLDLNSGEKKQLTNQEHGESAPVFSSDGKSIFYTRLASAVTKQAVMRLYLRSNKKEVLLMGASSCSQNETKQIICALNGKLYLLPDGDENEKIQITSGSGLDSNPQYTKDNTLFYTHYEQDSSGDELLGIDDNSSIWMAKISSTPPYLYEQYRLTKGGGFHQHPIVVGGMLYYSNIETGNIVKNNIENFFKTYKNYNKAQTKAGAAFTRGDIHQGLQILGNLVANPAQLTDKNLRFLELEYIAQLRAIKMFDRAQHIIKQLATKNQSAKAMAEIQSISLKIHRQKERSSRQELRELVNSGVKEILAIEKKYSRQYGQNIQLLGMTHIEASTLYLLVDNSIAALSQLAKVDKLDDEQMQAQALFSRGKVYRHLNNDNSLKKVFMDVINRFGEDTPWGNKAIAYAIAVSEKGSNYKHKIAALRDLIQENPKLTQLGSAALLRMAQIYEDHNETRKTVAILNEIGEKYPKSTIPLTRSLWWKAQTLANLGEHKRASQAYGKLAKLPESEINNTQKAAKLMTLQRVLAAVKLRDAGDAKVAAKTLGQIIKTHPQSVEAHRGYIATKVMLGDGEEIIKRYAKLAKNSPDNAIIRYSYALALTYSKKPDFSDIISRLEKAVKQRPDISYFHQTLAWSHEQFETKGEGGRGHLEKAARHYQTALSLTDPLKTPQVEADLLMNLGNVFYALKNYSESYRFFRSWQRRNRPLKDPLSASLLHKTFGESSYKTEHSKEAVEQYQLALDMLPNDKKMLRLELLEKLGLTQQTLGNHVRAAEAFSQALEENLALGITKNLAILQRNIGANLHESINKDKTPDRDALKKALASYLKSVTYLAKHGKQEQKKGSGFFNVMFAVGSEGSKAAFGFDLAGEQKLLFGFIANVYEKLEEPQPSLSFYKKKLGLYTKKGDDDPGTLGEKAVTLNRVSQLSYKMGNLKLALENSLKSLELAQELKLEYGIATNLYNLSKIAVDMVQANKAVDPLLVEKLYTIVSTQNGDVTPTKTQFFTESNIAYLLATLPIDPLSIKKGNKVQRAVAGWQRLFKLKSNADKLYRKAEKRLLNNKLFTAQEILSYSIRLKLNRLTIATIAQKQSASSSLIAELNSLIDSGWSESSWIFTLLKGENSVDDAEKKELLHKAVMQATAYPASITQKNSAKVLAPFYTRLLKQHAELAIEQDDYESLFVVAETLQMHQAALQLKDKLGADFFLNGIDTDTNPVVFTLDALKKSLVKYNIEQSQSLKEQLEEQLFEGLDNHPQAIRFLLNMDVEAVTEFLSPEHPYVKVVAGFEKNHIFLHDGEQLLYARLKNGGEIVGKDLKQALIKAKQIYLSAPTDKPKIVNSLPINNKAVAKLQTLMDLLPSTPSQGLFFNRIVQVGNKKLKDITPKTPMLIVDIPVVGAQKEDLEEVSTSNIFVATAPFDKMTISTSEKNQVKERIKLKDFYFPTGHTFFLTDPTGLDTKDRPLLATALIRSGFPHVIFTNRALSQQEVKSSIESYLTNVAKFPALTAINRVWHENKNILGKNPFTFYGGAGINQEQIAERAEDLFDEELAMAQEAFGQDDLETTVNHIENALVLINKAGRDELFAQLSSTAVNTLFKLGKYQRAVWHQKQILSHHNKSTPEAVHAKELNIMGMLYSRLEKYKSAVFHLEQAVKIATKIGNKEILAEGANTLGIVKESQGAYSGALAAFDISFTQFQLKGDKKAMAEQYRRIGRIYHKRLARYFKAREFFNKANKLFKESKDLKGEALALIDIGLTYEKTGDFNNSKKYYNKGIKIGQRLDDPFLLATGYLNLANTSWFQGDYQQAFKLLINASNQANHASKPHLEVMIANTRGLLYWTLNENDKALLHLQKAIDKSKRDSLATELASSLNNKALVLRATGNLDDALYNFQQAMVIDAQQKSLWGLSYDNRNIGIVLMKKGQHEDAEERLLVSETISSEISNPINQSKAQLELGNLYKKIGRVKLALNYYSQAFEIAKKLHLKEVVWRASAGMGDVLWQQNKPKEAFAAYDRAINIVEGMRSALKIDALRNSFQENKQDLYRNMITLLVAMGDARKGFDYLERFRSRNFIDLLANQKIELKRPEDEKELKHVSNLFQELDNLAQELAATKKPSKTQKSRYKRQKAIAEEAQLELLQKNPELSAFISVNPLTLKQFEGKLEKGVGTIAYLLTKKELYIWVTNKKGTKFKRVAVTEKELTAKVREYRDLMQNIEPVEKVMSQLYKWLIKPIEDDIADLKYIGIIPHGPLYFLSFSALRGENGYFVEEYPLFYSPSASAMEYSFKKRTKTKRTKILAIGNPDLGNLNFDLPLAEYEAGSIQWTFPDGDLLVGKKATKKWIVENISKYGIIHIAAHGDFQGINPLFSSLWLSAKDQQKGRLTVKEIFSLDINADLVTLSACQTGLGTLQGSELIGLNRAFLYAGTHALISSLWRVDDLATAVLMKHFYRNYSTMNKAQSLQKAQQTVKQTFPHPANWAGFNLMGDYQ
ncbi:MAG: CHAT domain-containing protein [Magnetococcales bacterium]|nr:CHAT domain-containing protein [Magnetococcales bacterium]